MAELTRQGRYDRMTDTMCKLTGEAPTNMRDFVKLHAAEFKQRGPAHSGANQGSATATVRIKTYPTKVEAELARIALDAAGVASVVVGTDVGMEGGAAGVQLLVEDDRVELALKVLGDA
jgi:hypothetical protein